MAQVRLETADNPGKWFESGEDHGKPVRYKIRPIPIEVDRRLHRDVYRGANVGKLRKQSAATAIERAQEYTILRAAYALLDTGNFSVEIGDKETAERFSALLGESVVPCPDLYLDGKWNDELRRAVLATARRRAAWISNKADELVEAQVEDEEEETEDF
jgi:hypothetical protein